MLLLVFAVVLLSCLCFDLMLVTVVFSVELGWLLVSLPCIRCWLDMVFMCCCLISLIIVAGLLNYSWLCVYDVVFLFCCFTFGACLIVLFYLSFYGMVLYCGLLWCFCLYYWLFCCNDACVCLLVVGWTVCVSLSVIICCIFAILFDCVISVGWIDCLFVVCIVLLCFIVL